VTVADHGGDAVKRGDFARGALRIATGHHNLRRRVGAVRAANKGARLAVGLGGHAARIDDKHFGIREPLHAMAGEEQAAPQRFAVGARRPATEVLHVKAGHLS
jgi:hypothetical protein